ncbi:MAG TPA: AraC family transcriptional regulator [Bradyrhizobium sp.]|uniref:AraC family transcriptional regulator n=1 Tax=Bradyrhizobium sp. TaxID=376 RepID=UPI002CC450F6|nr:AraC family transcriptional regulator [Bradyrhizobium sp.]HLZ03977.1 AraC family transcriptional regulator [Bradyrhizobium sp.]
MAIEAVELIEDVRIALDHDLGGAIRATARLAALLRAISPEILHTPPARGGLAPWQKRKVQDYVERHIEGPIPLEDLAKLASLSVGYFCRAFKESFDETPHAYIMRARLERAQELMLETTDPLSQIALACGLADQAHFSRFFRQATGETPSAWRRNRANGG